MGWLATTLHGETAKDSGCVKMRQLVKGDRLGLAVIDRQIADSWARFLCLNVNGVDGVSRCGLDQEGDGCVWTNERAHL